MGRTHSPETRKKISASKKAAGYRHSEEVRRRISESRKGKAAGSQNYQWKADRAQLSRFSKQGERRTSAYFYWRKTVWVRDNFNCKLANQDCKGKIEAHHIYGWTDYPAKRYELNNGITLCHAHHPRVRAEEKRLRPLFKSLASVSKVTL